jgi:hypothetical protein
MGKMLEFWNEHIQNILNSPGFYQITYKSPTIVEEVNQ